jgi:hypothetical protein
MDSYRYYCVPGTQQPRPRFDANTKAISLFAPLYCTVIISVLYVVEAILHPPFLLLAYLKVDCSSAPVFLEVLFCSRGAFLF